MAARTARRAGKFTTLRRTPAFRTRPTRTIAVFTTRPARLVAKAFAGKWLLVAERLLATGRSRRRLTEAASGLVVAVGTRHHAGVALGHEFLGRPAVLVEVDMARGRGVLIAADFLASRHGLAGVGATRTILSRPLGAHLFFALFRSIGEAETLAGNLHRVGAASGQTVARRLAFERIGFGRHFAFKIHVGGIGQLLAQLVAQHLGLDRFHPADGNVAELERAIADADQPVDLKAQRAQHVLDLAVLAFAQRQHQPHIGALLALQRCFNRAITDAVDLDPVLEPVEGSLGHGAMGAHPIAAQPAGRRQFQNPLQTAIIGEQQQPFGVDVEPPDRHYAGQAMGFEMFKDRFAAFGVLFGDHEASRLMIKPDAGALPRSQRRTIHGDLVTVGDVEGRRQHLLAVDHDAPFGDPHFGIAPRAEAGTGNNLGQAVASVGLWGGVTHGQTFCHAGPINGGAEKAKRPETPAACKGNWSGAAPEPLTACGVGRFVPYPSWSQRTPEWHCAPIAGTSDR